jgi:hypothetical protein
MSFPRASDKPRNEYHVNTIEYSSESSNNEEADMCVPEWSWGSKSKPFVCSSLKPASKSRQDEICYTFNAAKCDRIFDYLLQEKQIKLSSGHVYIPNRTRRPSLLTQPRPHSYRKAIGPRNRVRKCCGNTN